MKSRPIAIAAFVGAFFAIVPVVPNSAHADDSVTVIARKRFQEGVQLFDQKKYDEARVAFVQAYALKKHPVILLNLAQSELKSNHPVHAARHFAQFLRENKNAKPAELKLARQGLADARKRTGRIDLHVDIPYAEVLVEGESVGTTPLPEPVDVKPGTSRIEVKTSTASRTITVTTSAQQLVTAEVKFKEDTDAASVDHSSESSDKDLEPTEKNEISVSTDGGSRESFISWMSHDEKAWAGAGLTLLGAGVGIGFAAAYSQANSNAQSIANTIKNTAASDKSLEKYQNSPDDPTRYDRRTNPCAAPVPSNYADACAKLKDNLDKRDTDETFAWIGGGLFVVGVASTTAMYFIFADDSSKSSSADSVSRIHRSRIRAAVSPVLTPDVRGLTVGGTF